MGGIPHFEISVFVIVADLVVVLVVAVVTFSLVAVVVAVVLVVVVVVGRLTSCVFALSLLVLIRSGLTGILTGKDGKVFVGHAGFKIHGINLWQCF